MRRRESRLDHGGYVTVCGIPLIPGRGRYVG